MDYCNNFSSDRNLCFIKGNLDEIKNRGYCILDFNFSLWLLKGSPTLENAVITIGLFIISSELMLWKKYFEIDKNTAVSFMRLKNDISNISKKLDGIEKLIRNKK